MQDRFKFRVWDKSKNRYLDDTSLEERLYHNATELLGACLALNDGNVNYDYTFEQCTGVKDKNGKLIYEGDIIHFDHEKYVVCYDDVEALYGMNNQKDELISFCGLDTSDIKIIGNIHEDTEVLE